MADSSIVFKRTIKKLASTIEVEGIFKISRPQFDKEEYPYLEQYFEKVYKIIDQPVLFRKGNSS